MQSTMIINRVSNSQRRFLAVKGKGNSKIKSSQPPSGTEYLFGQTPIAQALIERRRSFRQLLYVASNSLEDDNDGRGKKAKDSSLSHWTQRILDLAVEAHLTPTPVAPSVIDALAQGQRHQGITLLASNLKAEARLKGLGRVEDLLVNGSEELSYSGRITDKETVPFTFVQTERRPFPVWVGTPHF